MIELPPPPPPPHNTVTPLPIKNQEWEANLLVESIAELKEKIKTQEATLAKRRTWIKEAKRLGRP
jgi:hypothetical protein